METLIFTEKGLFSLSYSCHRAKTIHSIYTPSAPSTGPLIIYLPRHGWLSSDNCHTSPPPAAAADDPIPVVFTSSQVVVRVNYAWSRSRPFPRPLHDVLSAYDWIRDNLVLPAQTRGHGAPRRRAPRQIAVYGSEIGGSLAAALALTECRPGGGGGGGAHVAAFAVRNAVFDWPGAAVPHAVAGGDAALVDDASDDGGGGAAEMRRLARRLFRTPAACFDPFASPAYFFRTAGRHVPPRWPGEDATAFGEGEEEGRKDEASDLSSSPPSSSAGESPRSSANSSVASDETHPSSLQPGLASSSSSSSSSSSGGGGGGSGGGSGGVSSILDLRPAQRKAHIKFPPRDSGLRIPHARLITSSSMRNGMEVLGGHGHDRLFAAQAEEMARLMRRSVVRHELGLRAGVEDGTGVAEERVRVVREDGAPRGPEADDGLEDVAQWFRDVVQ